MNSPRRARRVPCALSLALLLLLGGAARGQTADKVAPVVLMHVAAAAPVAEALVERVRPRLAADGVELVVNVTATVDVDAILGTTASVSDTAPVAEVWLDGRSPTDATIFVVPRLADRVLARRIALASGFDEVALAEIVFIVERSVTALLDSQPVGVPKDEARALLRPPPPTAIVATKATPPRAPVEPPRVPVELRLGAFFGSESWSRDDALVPVLGLVATAERVGPVARLGLSLDADWRRDLEADAPDAKLTVAGGTAHLLFTLGRSFVGLGTWRLLLGPGLAIDHVQATPSISGGHVNAPSRTDVDLAFGARLGWGITLGPRLGAFAAIGADVVPVAGRYTAVVDGASTVLVSSWPVRPTFLVGLAFGGGG